MTTNLIIIRHGNTFDKGDVCTRVGKNTDMALSNSGKDQGILLGKFFQLKNIKPDVVFTSNLQRTYQTAEIALKEAGLNSEFTKLEIFDEVDYGPDENKTEEDVIARIGEQAIEDWNKSGITPPGWKFDSEKTIQDWKDFAAKVEKEYKDKTVVVVTSNGVARFTPHLTGDFNGFIENNKIKISTAACCFFHKEETDKNWTISEWNAKPKDHVTL